MLSPWRGLPRLEVLPDQLKRLGILLDRGGSDEARIVVREGKSCRVWFVEDVNGKLVKRSSLLSLSKWSEWSDILGVDSDICLCEVWKELDPLFEEETVPFLYEEVVDYELDDSDLFDTEPSLDVMEGLDSDEVGSFRDVSGVYDTDIEAEFSDGLESIDREFRDTQSPTDENVYSDRYEGPLNNFTKFSRSFVENKRGRKPKKFVTKNSCQVAENFCQKCYIVDNPLYPPVDQFDDSVDPCEKVVIDEEVLFEKRNYDSTEECDTPQIFSSEHRARVVSTIIATVKLMTKSNKMDKDLDIKLVEDIWNLCNEAFCWGDSEFDESDARTWGAGGGFTNEQLAEDLQCLLDADDFDDMVSTRLKLLKPNRLNLDRVAEHVSSDCVDLPLIKELAADDGGMDLFLPPEYVPNSVTGLPKLSKSYLETHEAVDKMIGKNFRDKGLAMVFKLEEITKRLPFFSVALAKWTKKKGEEGGRNIHDATYHMFRGWCLNNDFSQQACKDHCGAIDYPSIEDIICMIWKFWEREKELDPTVRWSDLRLWKMDLKGAFTLLDFKATCVKHMALLLHGGLIVFFLCGVFGWTGTPGYFQILSRVLMFELAKVYKGLARMFCDDIMGVCWAKDVKHEIGVTRVKILGLVGPNTVAEKKTEIGTALVELGYLVDLRKMSVSISRRNLLKALYGFMEIREFELVTFKMIERLASWGSRYSFVCVHMAPMVRLLYNELRFKPRWYQWILSQNGKIAVWFFRAFLVLTDVIEGYYCRPLWSLRPLRAWLWICEFDACLQGLGCVWYQCSPDGTTTPIGAASWSIESLGFGKDASFQNTAEFMAAIMSTIGLIRYGGAGQPTLMRGDSKSALSWADKKRYKGNLAVPAGFLFNYIWIHYRVLICKCVHLPGEENVACDDLTRIFLENVKGFKELAKLDRELRSSERKYAFDYSAVGDRSASVDFEEFKEICNPQQVWESEEDFGVFWGRMTKWCVQVLGVPPEEKIHFPEEWEDYVSESDECDSDLSE